MIGMLSQNSLVFKNLVVTNLTSVSTNEPKWACSSLQIFTQTIFWKQPTASLQRDEKRATFWLIIYALLITHYTVPVFTKWRPAWERHLMCAQAVNHCGLCSSLHGLGHASIEDSEQKIQVIQTEGFHALPHSCCSSVVLKPFSIRLPNLSWIVANSQDT